MKYGGLLSGPADGRSTLVARILTTCELVVDEDACCQLAINNT